MNPCKYTQCGTFAVCRSDNNHHARCHCLEGYRGNPLVQCSRPECTSDNDCSYNLACRNEKCSDPCDCAPTAQCTVQNHVPSCRCPAGFEGNPSVSCTQIKLDTRECTMDADCSSKLACFSSFCKNPCLETKPCGAHATCTVVDSLPLRTMVCTCQEGFIGDADKECRPGKLYDFNSRFVKSLLFHSSKHFSSFYIFCKYIKHFFYIYVTRSSLAYLHNFDFCT